MTIPRDLLARAFPGEPRLIYEFEDLARTVDDTAAASGEQVAATAALQDATVVTLSPNEALTNERVLTQGRGLRFRVEPGRVIIGADVSSQGGAVRLTVFGDTALTAPQTGTLATTEGDELFRNKTLDRLRVLVPPDASTGIVTHRVRVTVGGVEYWMLLQAV